MPRIPEAGIERLKAEVSVRRLVEVLGVDLKKSGKDWVGRCRFHEDDTTPCWRALGSPAVVEATQAP